MAEGVAAVPEKVGDGLGHKLGPLPVWVWIVGGVLGAAAIYYFIVGKNANGGSGSPFLPSLGGGYGGPTTGGSGGGTTSTTATPTTATAAAILSAQQSVATSLQIPLNEVQLYWNDYIAGTSPLVGTQQSGVYGSVISALNTILGGTAPTPAGASVNANPYTSNTTWLNSLLGFLPTGTGGSFEGESLIQIEAALSGVVNGTVSELTQAEADALSQAQGIVGNAPNPLTFTVKPAAPAGTIGNPAIVLPGQTAPPSSTTTVTPSVNPILTSTPKPVTL
jgi:hypothetical protein